MTFPKLLMLIRQVHQKSAIFIILDKGFQFRSYICNGCHDISMMSISLSDIATLNIKGADYQRVISGIGKSEAIKLMEKMNFSGKSEYYKT